MGRTGWCRECQVWTQVDENGSCARGHGADSVDAVHDEASASKQKSSAVGGFGVGEMPRELERFNWGAFFLTPLWGIVYGSAAVLGWFLVGLLFTLFLASFLDPTSALATITIAATIAAVVEIVIRLWVGVNANRWLWARERARLDAAAGARAPRYDVATYQGKQLKWFVVGAVLVVLSTLGLAFLGLAQTTDVQQIREQLSITRVQIATSAFWTFVEVVLAAWLARKMREEAAGAVGAAS